jgi:hypothetical protein
MDWTLHQDADNRDQNEQNGRGRVASAEAIDLGKHLGN